MELIDANAHGNVHGGVIMRMVDEAAAIVAIKHSQNPTVVTARVERFDFLAPAFIGDVVSVHCEMSYVGRTSMEVGVEVMAEDVITANDEEKTIIERARIRRMHWQKIDEELKRAEEVKD